MTLLSGSPALRLSNSNEHVLQQVKSFLIDQLGIPPSVVLALVGTATHLLLNAILGRSATSPWGLLGPLLLGMALESYEIWIQYRGIGLFSPGNDPLLAILGRHGLDVLLMLAGPLLVVVVWAISAR